MTTNGSTHWAPPPGRHKVDVGGSLKRALRARRGVAATTNKNMPVSDYYLFRYNFRPESVDTSRPGVVEVKRSKDSTHAAVQVERPIAQSDDVHSFRGSEEPSKEIECVLIYDEETNTYTLEKLDSSLRLTHEGKGRSKTRLPSVSPAMNTPSPAASTSRIDPEEEVERELLNALSGPESSSNVKQPDPPSSDSSMDMDVDEFENFLNQSLDNAHQAMATVRAKKAATAAAAKSRGKKAAAQDVPAPTETPFMPPKVSTPTAPTTTKKRPLLKGSSAAAAASSTPPPQVKTVTTKAATPSGGKARSKSKPGPLALNPSPVVAMPYGASGSVVEIEELSFGKPAKVTRTRDVASTVAKSPAEGLALSFAGSSAAFMPGPLPSAPTKPPVQQQQQQEEQQDDDDGDDGEWDLVAGAGADPSPTSAGMPFDASSFGGGAGPVVASGGDQLEQLAADLDQQLLDLEVDDGDGDAEGEGDDDEDIFGDEDFEQAQAEAEAASAVPKGRPMSLNQFAGGAETAGLDEQDDDDYSSSEEESDDD